MLPRNLIFIYRNVRISDIILYGLTIYSLYCSKEYIELLKSKSFIIIKYLFFFFVFEFIISAIAYKVDVIEYFFRLKQLWTSLLVFSFMLLFKRGGLGYLIKLVLPFAVVSNIFYILSAVTGAALLPDVGIVQQDLPGGLKVWRVFGGTFFGEFFLLGIVFYWNEYKFRLIQLPFVVLFGLPHILAFGRGAWVLFSFAVVFITLWSSFRKHNIRTLVRQAIIIVITLTVFLTVFNQFIPKSEELTDAIEVRIQQGQDDKKYSEGTFGTRLQNRNALIELWALNPVFGIGMHPLWVIKPTNTEEDIYAWGFSDVRWASVLAAYGAVGFLLALIFQVYYLYTGFKVLRKIKVMDHHYFFLLYFFIVMIRDTFISYEVLFTTITIFALGSVNSFLMANFVYSFEKARSGDEKPVNS